MVSESVYKQSKEELLRFLIEEYAEQIKRLAYTYVKYWSTAEDIMQEVYIKCYQKLETFRGESSYKTWLYKIAINKSKDYLKSKWYKNIFPSENIYDSILKTTDSPELQLMENQENIAFLKLVMDLPSIYREVIILFYYEQLKISEIHEVTGVNQETLKTRLRRAKKILRNKYERWIKSEYGSTSKQFKEKYGKNNI